MYDGKLFEQEPKSRAGRRTVAFPREIADELRWHLERFAEPTGDGLVFVGPLGGRLRRSNFRDIWLVALSDALGPDPVDRTTARCPHYSSMTIEKKVDASGREPGGAAGPAIAFRLDPSSGVPTYLQLVQQVEQALRLGYLTQGDRLPTLKEATEQLAINPNTVLKAYRELEHRGLAAGRPGQGTFIEATLRHVDQAEQAALHAELVTWLQAAAEAGLDDDGMTALFGAALRDFRDRPADRAPRRPRRGRTASGQAGAVA